MAHETLAEALQSSVVMDDGIGDRSSSSDAVSSDPSLSRNVSLSRLNAEAPEFVPRTTNRVDLQQQPPPRLVVPHGPGSSYKDRAIRRGIYSIGWLCQYRYAGGGCCR
ncbi:hypothetical protein NE237_027416 [Protea cynaroides]|uniref:Uncharacterized protein n=1 Tax=Protea cynaroides TaxID=273540 RepID=A0A9Q0JRW4_9MAGN|nr:hypothetical protein NE237_027416 [Protea cynaroides]